MIVVTGGMHSGTSLVSGTLRCLGLNMGEIDNERHEDTVIANGNMHAVLQHIKMIDGFKWPMLRHNFRAIFPFLQDVKFIYCYRSLYEKTCKRPELHVLTEHLEEGAFWGKFFREQNVTPLVVDFNQSPEELVRDLVVFLNLNPTDEQLTAAISFNNKERGYYAIS